MKRLIALLTALTTISLFGAFKYETTLTISGYTADETLANFPLLVRISAAKISGFAYDKCQSDGKDIVFTSADGATTFPHEIDEWNADGESLVWVKIPALTKGMTFKMKFGDASLAAAPAYTTNGSVWNGAGYFGVYHMNDTTNEGTANYTAKDSSPFGYTGTPFSNNGGSYFKEMISTAGAVGKARVHQKTSSWNANGLKFAGSEIYKAGTDFAFSGWFNMSTLNGSAQWAFHRNNQADAAGFRLAGNSYVTVAGSSGSVSVTIDNPQNQWVHVAVVFSNGTAKIYSNGVLKKTGNCTVTDPDVAYSLGNAISANGYPMMGSYDEYRLLDATPSEAWIAATYGCQSAADYITASTVLTVDVANTITVSSCSTYQCAGVSPNWGTSAISAGEVTCTAPEDTVVSETSKYGFTGWKLRVVDAEGKATTTSGEGRTCTFTHVEGESANLEWQHNLYYLATVTSSDSSLGSTTGSGWVGEGTTHSISALPNSGNELKKWTSDDMLAANLQDNPYSYKVMGPFTAEATFCTQRYVWIGTTGGLYWKDAKNWKDIDGDGTGDVPPKDGTATVVLPHYKGSYYIYVDKDVNLYGLYLKASETDNGSSGNAVSLYSGPMTLGAGGIESDDSQYAIGIKFGCPLTLSASQAWMNKSSDSALDNAKNNNGFAINSKLTAAEDVVLTVSGSMPFYPNANNTADFKGTIRTNCRVKPSSNSFMTHAEAPAKLEAYATDEPYPSCKDDKICFDTASNGNEIKITAPVKLDLADNNRLMKIQLQVSSNIQSNRWNYNWAGPISGAFKDKMLSFGNVMESSSQHRSHHPRKQRNYITSDNSGLSIVGLPAICFPHGVFTIANTNALGTGNVLPAYFGSGDTAGYFKGLTVSNGITVASAMSINNAGTPTLLGMLDAGEGTFSGNFTGNQLGSVFLHAVPNAKVHFTGAFTMNNNNNYSLEAVGGGEIYLEGDNAQVTKKPLNVRSAKVILGHNNAAGTQTINLGGVVPSVVKVRAVRDRGFAYCGSGAGEIKYTVTRKDANMGIYTFSSTSLVFDGVSLNVGDSFLWINDMADGQVSRIFKVVALGSSGSFEGVSLPYAVGMKVYVEEGDEYAGSTFMIDNGASAATATSCGSGSPVQDVTDPDVAVLASKGVTIANEINVTDNKSAGKSMIGVADDSSVMFSGKITLNRAVTFYAAAGGTATFTNEIADVEGQTNSVSVAGAGTVVLSTLDWKGRTLDLSNFDTAELEASNLRRVKLLSAKGVGEATVLKPTNTGKWSISVLRDSVMASKGGMTVIVR